MSFTKKSPSETYKDIIYIDNSNSGFDGIQRRVKSGDGTDSVIRLANNVLDLRPSQNSNNTFNVYNNGGTSRLAVDTKEYEWLMGQQAKLQADYDKGLQILMGGRAMPQQQ